MARSTPPALFGDIRRFGSQASVAKYAGLAWTQHQSGDFEAGHSQMIKSGNRDLRYYLLEAANSARGCCGEVRRYYYPTQGISGQSYLDVTLIVTGPDLSLVSINKHRDLPALGRKKHRPGS